MHKSCREKTNTSSDARRINVYRGLLKPLDRLREIRNFFASPTMGSWPGDFASILEKSIMGKQYDAIVNEKLRERRRKWNDGCSLEGPVLGPDGREIWLVKTYPDAY